MIKSLFSIDFVLITSSIHHEKTGSFDDADKKNDVAHELDKLQKIPTPAILKTFILQCDLSG